MRHGGDIYRNKIEYDFSVNINPFRYELNDGIFKTAWNSLYVYPDIRCERLSIAIADRYGLDEKNVVCGNGASELFVAIVRAVCPSSSLLLSPTFNGYEYALNKCQIKRYKLSENKDFELDEGILDYINKDCDILFLGNPENPSGRRISEDLLDKILELARLCNTTVVLDDCFYELSTGHIRENTQSLLNKYHNLIIVNAFTKTYGMPGLRLGYMMSKNSELIGSVKNNLSEWNVSGMAQIIGTCLAQDLSFVKKSHDQIKIQKDFLVSSFEKMNIKCYPSEANFFLTECDASIYEKLLDKKILVRNCETIDGLRSGFFRIAVKGHMENQFLIKSFEELL